MTTQPKRPRGRPKGSSKPPGEKARRENVCYRPEHDEIVEAIKERYGLSAWFQAQLEKARL